MKTIKYINLIMLAAILFCKPGFTAEQAEEYKISPNDLIQIKVYDEPDLSETVRVAANGLITYPLVGSVDTKGLTAKGLEKKITDLLQADYLINPQVTVFVQEYGKFSILGNVRSPGSYQLKSGMKVVDAISLAGGFSDKANAENVKLVRTKEGGQKETTPINVKEITEQNNTEKDIELKPGDLIIVGELSEASYFILVLGQVRSPGRYPYKEGLTAVEAIAMAGGVTDMASSNSTRVIREGEGKNVTFTVPVASILKGAKVSRDVKLEPGDKIVVPESFF